MIEITKYPDSLARRLLGMRYLATIPGTSVYDHNGFGWTEKGAIRSMQRRDAAIKRERERRRRRREGIETYMVEGGER